jgi:taurine dioxygenase
MTIIRSLSPTIGAEVTDVNLAEQLDGDADWSLIDELRQLWLDRHLLLFPRQSLTADQQQRLASWFGHAEASTPQAMQVGQEMPTPVHYISNRVDGGRAGDGELVFHSDSASRPYPIRAVVLHALQVPDHGGETLFANCVDAWSTLPDLLRSRIAGLRAHHGFDYEREEKSQPGGPGFHAEHSVAMTHPLTGETVLYLSRNATTNIVGLAAAESAALLDELFSYIEAPGRIYRHKWLVGDVVIWDNVALVHARTAFDPGAARTLQRITVSGSPAEEPAAGEAVRTRSPGWPTGPDDVRREVG